MNSKLVILAAILYIASAASGNLVVRYQQELVVDCSGLSGDVALFKSHADGTSSKVEAGEDVSVADKVFTIKQISMMMLHWNWTIIIWIIDFIKKKKN